MAAGRDVDAVDAVGAGIIDRGVEGLRVGRPDHAVQRAVPVRREPAARIGLPVHEPGLVRIAVETLDRLAREQEPAAVGAVLGILVVAGIVGREVARLAAGRRHDEDVEILVDAGRVDVGDERDLVAVRRYGIGVVVEFLARQLVSGAERDRGGRPAL